MTVAQLERTADFLERQGSHANRPPAFFLFGTRLTRDTGGPECDSGLGSSFRCFMTLLTLRLRRTINVGLPMPFWNRSALQVALEMVLLLHTERVRSTRPMDLTSFSGKVILPSWSAVNPLKFLPRLH
jgi:hypothetical protein